MSQYSVYDTILSRKLATSSTNFFDDASRQDALNFALREFTDEYNPPELRKRAPVVFRRDGTTIHDCDAYNSATYGTFAAVASTDATNVATDTSGQRFGSGSVSFDISSVLSVNNYAEIEVASLTSLDLSSLSSTGLVRMWIYMPTVTDFTSISLYLGSSSVNYYLTTVTSDIAGNDFSAGGWVRVEFDLANASTNGTPVSASIDYLKLRFTYSADFAGGTGFAIDDIMILGAGTPQIDYNYLVATFPSDLTGFERIRRVENTTTGRVYLNLDSASYEASFGDYFTSEYNMTTGTLMLYLRESTSLNSVTLLMTYLSNPNTLDYTVTTGDSGLNSKSDELVALYAAHILLTEARDFEAAAFIEKDKNAAARTWQNRYGMNTRRLKSRYERMPYHGRA